MTNSPTATAIRSEMEAKLRVLGNTVRTMGLADAGIPTQVVRWYTEILLR